MSIYKLNPDEMVAYNQIRQGFKDDQFNIPVNARVSMNRIHEIYRYALSESHCVVVDSCNTKSRGNLLISSLLFPQRELKYKQKEFSQITTNILNEVYDSSNSTYQNIKNVYDFLTHSITYSITGNPMEYNSWGAIVNKQAVCQGISYAFAQLLNKIEIPCGVVSGEVFGKVTGPHAWNIVEVDGQFYHVDVTWGLNTYDVVSLGRYDYFMVTDNEISKDHKWDDHSIPKCEQYRFNYFIMNDCYATSRLSCKRIMSKQIKKSEQIYVKVTDDIAKDIDEKFFTKIFYELVDRFNVARNSCTYSYNQAMHVFSLKYL